MVRGPLIDPGDEPVEVVDDEDHVIDVVPRREVRRRGLLHRCTYVLVLDPAGRVYVHRRTHTKDIDPGSFAVTAGGVNSVGESYDACAIREVAEELGVNAIPTFRFKHRYEGPVGRCWGAAYDVVWDGQVRWQPAEVAWGDHRTLEEVDAMIGREPFCPDGLEVFERWRRWAGVRTAVPSDARWVGEVVRAAFEPYIERIGREPAPMLEEVAAAIEDAHVYVTDGRDGVLELVPHSDHLMVRDVAVRPGSQGRGVGTRLLRFAEVRAAELALSELRLVTNEAMVENLRFYPRRGYEETGRGEQDGYRRVFFRKVLSGPAGGPHPPT